jgi:hypothetical protein
VIGELGEGAFGKVYKAECRTTQTHANAPHVGQIVAVKQLKVCF